MHALSYATDEKGCRLESIIGTVNGELTWIQGSGLSLNTELTIDIQSYDENITTSAKLTLMVPISRQCCRM